MTRNTCKTQWTAINDGDAPTWADKGASHPEAAGLWLAAKMEAPRRHGICLLATASVPAHQMVLGTISDRELSVT